MEVLCRKRGEGCPRPSAAAAGAGVRLLRPSGAGSRCERREAGSACVCPCAQSGVASDDCESKCGPGSLTRSHVAQVRKMPPPPASQRAAGRAGRRGAQGVVRLLLWEDLEPLLEDVAFKRCLRRWQGSRWWVRRSAQAATRTQPRQPPLAVAEAGSPAHGGFRGGPASWLLPSVCSRGRGGKCPRLPLPVRTRVPLCAHPRDPQRPPDANTWVWGAQTFGPSWRAAVSGERGWRGQRSQCPKHVRVGHKGHLPREEESSRGRGLERQAGPAGRRAAVTLEAGGTVPWIAGGRGGFSGPGG